MTAGERVRAARELADISTKDLDRLAGLRPGVSWAVENSATGNSEIKTLDKIAKVLGLSLDYLVRGDGEEPAAEHVKASIAVIRAEKEPAA